MLKAHFSHFVQAHFKKNVKKCVLKMHLEKSEKHVKKM